MRRGKLSYSEKATQVARLIDLAEEIIAQTERLSPTDREHLIQFGRDAKKIALDPNPPFKRISSLELMESDLLAYWEDVLDEEINLLWTKIQENKLKIEDRRNIRLMLKRKKIRNRSEYNFVMDRITLAEQSGEITPKEAQLLSQLIREFEQQSKNDLDRMGEARTE